MRASGCFSCRYMPTGTGSLSACAIVGYAVNVPRAAGSLLLGMKKDAIIPCMFRATSLLALAASERCDRRSAAGSGVHVCIRPRSQIDHPRSSPVPNTCQGQSPTARSPARPALDSRDSVLLLGKWTLAECWRRRSGEGGGGATRGGVFVDGDPVICRLAR